MPEDAVISLKVKKWVKQHTYFAPYYKTTIVLTCDVIVVSFCMSITVFKMFIIVKLKYGIITRETYVYCREMTIVIW